MQLSTIDPDEQRAWLQLARSRGIGPTHALRLFNRFGSAVEAVAALPRLISTDRWPNCVLCSAGQADRERDAVARSGAHLLVYGDSRLPAALREIADPPVALIVRGSPALLTGEGVAIVGARDASANGCTLASRIAFDLAEAGMTIVSGLARGIDTFAHRGALDGGGTTIAFVGGGADVIYPPENAELTAKIAACGCVISERPLGAIPRARDFPRRNRLISGFAKGVLVVEAALRSGSLITARLAAEQGREVMAVPGSPLDPRHGGTNHLLKQGATLVENAADILSFLRPLSDARMGPDRPIHPSKAESAASRRHFAPGGTATMASPRRQVLTLEEQLLQLIAMEPVAVDELVRQCQASVAHVQEVLLELELDGRIDRHSGNRVSRRAA
ncbi:DNA processing protein [Arboricoccus pini]|uniref:DNA processing protein n=1 Tax=Arboricoccus pini TaxID=1963835 RepID=A0A212Q7X3_9PROT|nr:DNA-processing protein DprA [Arboricoccus pini]SNB55374.1 DNA processing protein [Arboricoccus pini]